MNVIWKYLDTRKATVRALEDLSSMRFIIRESEERLDLQARAPNDIEKDDPLQERYEMAKEYMDWFLPAWENLSEDERYVLEVFYTGTGQRKDPVVTICEHLYIERSSAYNKKNRALSRLEVLLFGRK